ncbi:MAG: nitronate monooxygenase [Acidimicrobiia bacterium]|nr:nitronate monooxygenase [Acidimicrobiia bacterium]MBT8246660.1 nitronate monooxygenase [Acidimicrobiia bacterium]NNJ46591.1 nitronate monooxygenase [Acidimicrobiia bacterium]
MPNDLPIIIQGGMGVAVSGWRLANAVSSEGQLGVVSGTALDAVLARRLQHGDPGGHMRRALAAFPIPGVADRIIDRYFVPEGTPEGVRLKTKPMHKMRQSRHVEELLVASNFVEVFLAKEGHGNPVGINYLEKLQIPTIPSLYGAMLGDVDYVLMGAGIPRAIPGILDRLSVGLEAELRIDVKGATEDDDPYTRFDPAEFTDGTLPPVKRPAFLAIVSSHILATMLAKKVEATVNGFVVEAPTAGGHNAPPRGRGQLTEDGEPLYGDRDEPDLEVIRQLGLPFWLAGSRAEPDQVADALALGATGVQVGTAFAFCEESGFEGKIKRTVLELSEAGQARVFTDPVASPTGFPFKVAQLEDTIAGEEAYQARPRVCDLGYLRSAYRRDDDSIGWRCASEPVEDFLEKGGTIEETVGRKCLCNALMANVGLGQVQTNGYVEPRLITSGDDIATVARFLRPGEETYRAADVLDYLLPGRVRSS